MRVLALASLLIVCVSTFAADAAKGQKLFKKCMSCHGADGMGKKSQKAPMIAGQYDWYIEAQLKDIKSQKRTNKNTKKMYPFVKKLTGQNFKDLAAYISKLPKKK